MSYIKKHKEGFILSILVHLAVLFILIKFGFFTPLPLPEEKGVLIDFGNNTAGIGKVEPKRKPAPVVEQKQEEIKEQVTPPPPKPKVDPTPPEPKVSEGKDEVMTQDFEKTVAVDEGKKKKEEEARKKLEEENRIKKELEEKVRKEKQEKERQENIEKQIQEAAEKRRLDSLQKIENARLAEIRRVAEQRKQDSIKRAKEQAKIDAINSRTKNAFGGSAGQNDNNSQSSGQGNTYQQGNQGTTTGTAGAERYGLGGGEGISFNLTGRSAESLKKPTYPGQEEGIVVVQITVNKYGKVTKAVPGVRGSTSLDSELLNAAKNAALATIFNEDVNAPAFQSGTITYRFVLD